MKITTVEVIPLRIANRLPGLWEGPRVEEITNEHVVFRIHSDEGLTGIGECLLNQRTTPSGIAKLIQTITPILANKDPYQREPLLNEMDQAIGAYPWVKAGVDTALFDLIGKASNKSIFALLGGSFRETLPIEYPLTERKANPEHLAKEARQATEAGYTFLELKAGNDPKLDVERVRAVREAVGDTPRLKVDMNASYPNAKVAIKTIRQMEAFDVDFIEQPLAGSDVEGMAKVTKATEVNIVADESALTLHDLVENVVRRKAADAVHIKVGIGKSGIAAAKEMLTLAEASEIIPMIGASYAFGIGIAAAHQVAATMRKLSRPDHYGRPYYVDDIISTPISESQGYVEVSKGPGLGVEVEEAKLEKYNSFKTLS